MKIRIFIISSIISLNLFSITHSISEEYLLNNVLLGVNCKYSTALSNENIDNYNNKEGNNRRFLKIGKSICKKPLFRIKPNLFLKEKLTSIAIIILTGPLGGHRLYLGTSAIVPIFYALTLGGGFGILPLIDFIYIVTTKDVEKLKNNDKIFMWIGN